MSGGGYQCLSKDDESKIIKMMPSLVSGVSLDSCVCLRGQTIDNGVDDAVLLDHWLGKMVEPPKCPKWSALVFLMGNGRHGQEYTVEKTNAESNMRHNCD